MKKKRLLREALKWLHDAAFFLFVEYGTVFISPVNNVVVRCHVFSPSIKFGRKSIWYILHLSIFHSNPRRDLNM